MKRIAAFDVYGVLSDGFGGVEWVKYLTEQGLFPKNVWDDFLVYVRQYKEDHITYAQLMRGVTDEYCRGMAGLSVAKVGEAAEQFSRANTDSIYSYARDLVGLFGENYMKILVSGSAHEVIDPFKEMIGADLAYASTIGYDGKKYHDGMVLDMSTDECKKTALERAAEDYNLTFDGSFGFGDTEHDIPMLEAVRYPIALNPNDRLREEAERRGWIMLMNGEDVVGSVRERLYQIRGG